MFTAKEYCRAESAEQALALLRQQKDNAILGGGLWMRQGRAAYQTLIDISFLGLDTVEEEENSILLGAMLPLRCLETEKVFAGYASGVLKKCCAPIVGVQLRNMATVGGSICSRLGYSDVITTLLALDAVLNFAGMGEVSLQDFLTGRFDADLLLSVKLPKDGRKAAYQCLRPTATDFAVLNLVIASLADGQWRVSVGSRPGVAQRCPEAEAFLAKGDLESAKEAVKSLRYSDCIRAGKEYRQEMSAVLLERAVKDLQGVTE